MKKILIEIAIIAAMLSALVLMFNETHRLKEENKRLLNNQEIWLSQKDSVSIKNQSYKVSDSLNAIKLSALQLTLKEYQKYKASDLEIIKQLKIKKSDLEKIIDLQTETINKFSAKLNDSIRIDTIYNTIDTLKCFSYKSEWAKVLGCIDKDSVDLQIKNKESLIVTETTIYKRFLGFLWKTNKIKSRRVDIVSKNPNTKIIGIDYISIKR